MMKKIIDANKLIAKMEVRESDNSVLEPNAVGIGYCLAVTHMKKEIDDIETESKYISKDIIDKILDRLKAKKQMHEYGGFEINRISIDEVVSIINDCIDSEDNL